MKRKRRHLTAEFKARVALEAIKGEKTAEEIARENEIAPAQISEWKKLLEERLGEVFQSKGERSREMQARERKGGPP
jgi:transposase-like protein